jgi:F-type H+-transporting ATPase subunit delta
MKKITPKKYAISLYEAWQQTPAKDHERMISWFVKLLAFHKALPQADKILHYLQMYMMQQEGKEAVTVTTAAALTKSEREHLLKVLRTVLQKEIVLTEDTDATLIGGAVIAYGDNRIDGSVQQQLRILAKSLYS